MKSPHVLVVEDDPFTLELLRDALITEDFRCTCVMNGAEAWERLRRDTTLFDAVLLDRGLPDLDGIEILGRLKGLPKSRQVPVIVQTARSSTADIEQGLQAGAYYYLVKPFSAETLVAILTAAIRDHQHQVQLWEQVHHASRSMASLKRAEFQFQSLAEANDIAALMAKVAPDPEQVVLGLAELMINAVEHGNLGIQYEEKGALLMNGEWHNEIQRRLQHPAYAGKRATLKYERDPDGFRFLISDQGLGFDWQKYLTMHPDRAFDLHGRGIAISAGCCFSRLEYRGTGNEVEAFLEG
jgi:DNA-binding response OmpR family regulator